MLVLYSSFFPDAISELGWIEHPCGLRDHLLDKKLVWNAWLHSKDGINDGSLTVTHFVPSWNIVKLAYKIVFVILILLLQLVWGIERIDYSDLKDLVNNRLPVLVLGWNLGLVVFSTGLGVLQYSEKCHRLFFRLPLVNAVEHAHDYEALVVVPIISLAEIFQIVQRDWARVLEILGPDTPVEGCFQILESNIALPATGFVSFVELCHVGLHSAAPVAELVLKNLNLVVPVAGGDRKVGELRRLFTCLTARTHTYFKRFLLYTLLL